jgi:hypothetical protein
MNPKVKRSVAERRPTMREQSPCFVTTLVKLRLAEKNISNGDAYQLFLRLSTESIVQAKSPRGFKPPRVTAPYLETALRLNALTESELKSLRERIAEYR